MRKRNLVTFALGSAAGYVVGRYPSATYEKLRDGAGMTVGLARERIGGAGDHRAPTGQAAAADDGVADRTSTAYVSRPHP